MTEDPWRPKNRKIIKVTGLYAGRDDSKKTEVDRIELIVEKNDKANSSKLLIDFYEKGKTKPFDGYYMRDHEQLAFIEMLRDILHQDQERNFNQANFDEKGCLYWACRVGTCDKYIAIRIIGQYLVTTFDLMLKEKDIKTLFDALREVSNFFICT